MSQWLVVALSGVTNGGKSTTTKQLLEVLPSSTKLLCQDDYFYPKDSPHHVPCPGGLGHHNWDVITSMDMEKIKLDISNIINFPPKRDSLLCLDSEPFHSRTSGSNSSSSSQGYRPILLLDGFLLFDDAELTDACDIRFFFALTRDQCWERRSRRVYDPPDPPGYFEHCVWPMYEAHLDRVKRDVHDVLFLNGEEDHFEAVHQRILDAARLKPIDRKS